MNMGVADPATGSWRRDDLIGSWGVVSARGVLVDADGTRTESSKSLDGVIIFTPQHRMIVFVTDPGRKPAIDDAEALKLFRSMVAYTGRLTLEPDRYTVDIEFSSTQLNLDEPQLRFYRIDNDTLTIETPEHKNIFDSAKRNSNTLTAIRER
jgi:Lipocalin-like domain